MYDIDSDTLINYTNDWFTDDQVSWDENGENLYFVSNRDEYLIINDFIEPVDSVINKLDLNQR